jgi:hypothetical protein
MKLESQALILDFDPYSIRTEAEATHNVGELVVTADRKFRFAKAGEALSAGYLAVQDAIVAEISMAVVSGSKGDDKIVFTNAATTTTAGDYDGGYAVISYGTGIGQTYKIKSMAALTSGGASTVYIDGPIVTALDTTSKLDLVKNLYMDVTMTATATLQPAGVPLVAVTADNDFCWLQTRGVCGVFADGTAAAGTGVENDGSVAGAIDVIVEADYVVNPLVGRAFWHPAAASYAHPVFLMID